jgi:hypothetical protein
MKSLHPKKKKARWITNRICDGYRSLGKRKPELCRRWQKRESASDAFKVAAESVRSNRDRGNELPGRAGTPEEEIGVFYQELGKKPPPSSPDIRRLNLRRFRALPPR